MGTQGAFKNDLMGLEFDPLEPGGAKLKGEFILKTMLGIKVDNSKWWDLAFLYSIYARQTLHRLKKRPSFRKGPSFPSKRHQSLHPLSPPEDLNSLIH